MKKVAVYIVLITLIFASCEKSSVYKLYSACIDEDINSLNNLLDQGISPIIKLEKNTEIKSIAQKFIEKRNMTFSSDNEKIQYINNFSLSPLGIVSALGNKDIADLLLKYGSDINEKSGTTFRTPLLISARANNLEFTLYLLDKNADIHISDNTGATALHFAAYNNNFVLAEKLISLGANINQLDNNGQSPLLVLIANSNRTPDNAIMELFLKSGADLSILYNIRGPVNILYVAVANNHIEATKLLLKQNIDYNIKDSRGRALFDIAEINNSNELLNILRPYSFGLGDRPIQELSYFLRKPVPNDFKRMDVGDEFDSYIQTGNIQNNLLLQKGLIARKNGIVAAISYVWQSTDYEKMVLLRGDIIDKLEKEGVGRPSWNGSDQTIWFYRGFQIQLSTIGASFDKYPLKLSIL